MTRNRLFFSTVLAATLAASASYAATVEQACTASTRGAKPIIVQVDSVTGTLTENGNPVRDGAAKSLPHLAFFKHETGGSIIWGAINTLSGTTYYRYTLDLSTETLLYEAPETRIVSTCVLRKAL